MNVFQRFAATALAIASVAVQATPARATGTYNEVWEQHIELARVIQNHGVMVYINPPDCNEGDFMGFYTGKERAIVICQERGNADWAPYRWTAEDFDTLRHEAQHFIQDCRYGENHDHRLAPVYQEPVQFGLSVLGRDKVSRIVEVYREKGASEEIVILEIEAFAVAAMNDTIEQAEDIRNYCGASSYAKG